MTEHMFVWCRLNDTAWIDEFKLPKSLEPNFEKLWNRHPANYDSLKLYGKSVEIPRWQQTFGRSYTFSRMQHDPLPIPDELKELFDWANESDYGPFNQMFINWYQNGHHYIGPHHDDDKELVDNSPIMSISLGTNRKFRIRDSGKNIVRDISMSNGTVLVMCGTFNKDFTHEVPKIAGKKGEQLGQRINITFRRFK